MASEMNTESIKKHIPFFWTVQYGKKLRYAGHAFEYDEVIVDSPENMDFENPEFEAYYIRNDIAIAVCTSNRDPVASEFSLRMEAENFMTKAEVIQKVEKAQ